MKKESRELASQLLGVTNEALAPVYDEIRTKLMGSLATSSVKIEGLRAETEQRRANKEFLEHFRDLLPHANAWKSNLHTFSEDKSASVFEIADPYTAKAVLTNTLWHSDSIFESESAFRYYPHDYKPFYIVGMRKNPDHKKFTDVLLLSGDEKSKGLRQLLIKTPDTRQLEGWQSSYFASDFTPKEIDKIYDHDTGLLKLASTAPGVMYTASDMIGRDNVLRVRQQNYGFRDIIANSGPTDDELAQFQVPEYLNRLATAFGVVEKYQELLTANKPE